MKLNLGCGVNLMAGWCNLDLNDLADVRHDLETTPLPFPDNSIVELRAWHTLEHIRNLLPLMQDLYRCAIPDATFEIVVPYGSNDAAFEDPTHVRQFFSNSFAYFSQTAYGRADYGYTADWSSLERHIYLPPQARQLSSYEDALHMNHAIRNFAQDFRVRLRAVKPARPKGGGLETPRIQFHIKEEESEVQLIRPN